MGRQWLLPSSLSCGQLFTQSTSRCPGRTFSTNGVLQSTLASTHPSQELEASQEAALAQVRAESQKQVEELELSKQELVGKLSGLTSELAAVQEKAAQDRQELEKQLRVAQVRAHGWWMEDSGILGG